MADGNKRKEALIENFGEAALTEELMQTLVELNTSVSNMNKLLQQLQKNIANKAVPHLDAIASRTLH